MEHGFVVLQHRSYVGSQRTVPVEKDSVLWSQKRRVQHRSDRHVVGVETLYSVSCCQQQKNEEIHVLFQCK